MGKNREKKGEEKKKKGRMPCCEKGGVKKGAWTPQEDKVLVEYITKFGHGNWRNVPKFAGLQRCGKSCRLRWTNYLRPDIKRGPFSLEEENTIIHLHSTLGNKLQLCSSLLISKLFKWAAISSHLPGRTDNDVKNFWNSHLRKRLGKKILDQQSTPCNPANTSSDSPSSRHMVQWESVRLEAESRLSTQPMPLNAPSVVKFEGDYFLRLWNSKVGESFRNVSEWDGTSSQTSSLTKTESGSRAVALSTPCKTSGSHEMSEQKEELLMGCKKEPEELATNSDESKSYDMDDPADAMMKMLLDFPVGGDDTGFLQEPFDEDVSACIRV